MIINPLPHPHISTADNSVNLYLDMILLWTDFTWTPGHVLLPTPCQWCMIRWWQNTFLEGPMWGPTTKIYWITEWTYKVWFVAKKKRSGLRVTFYLDILTCFFCHYLKITKNIYSQFRTNVSVCRYINAVQRIYYIWENITC